MGYISVHGQMSYESSHGTFRNARRGGGAGFRILAGLVGVVILTALIAISLAVLRLRTEIYDLQDSRGGGTAQVTTGDLEKLRSEVAGALGRTAAALDQAREEAAQDRNLIKEALARLMRCISTRPGERSFPD